jgi:hypothetical protein
VKEFVLPMAEQIRRANPDAELSVQVRTEGDVDAIVALLADLEPELAGISILTSPETVETAVELVAALRPSGATPPLRPGATAGMSGEAGIPADAVDSTQRVTRRGSSLGLTGILFGFGFVLFGAAAALLAVAAALFLLWVLVREGNRDSGAG